MISYRISHNDVTEYPLVVKSPLPVSDHISHLEEIMKYIDPKYNLMLFMSVCNAWFHHHNWKKSYFDLENTLRRLELNTRIIAVKIRQTDTIIMGKTVKSNWQAIYSCRPLKDSLAELLSHHSSEEQNLERLKLAGDIYQSPYGDSDISEKISVLNTTPSHVFLNDPLIKFVPVTPTEIYNIVLSTIGGPDDYEPGLLGLSDSGAPWITFIHKISKIPLTKYAFKIETNNRITQCKIILS